MTCVITIFYHYLFIIISLRSLIFFPPSHWKEEPVKDENLTAVVHLTHPRDQKSTFLPSAPSAIRSLFLLLFFVYCEELGGAERVREKERGREKEGKRESFCFFTPPHILPYPLPHPVPPCLPPQPLHTIISPSFHFAGANIAGRRE